MAAIKSTSAATAKLNEKIAMSEDDNGLEALRKSIESMHTSIERLRQEREKPWPQLPEQPLATDKTGWNFGTFGIYINQRFSDLSLQLQQRFEAQQTSVSNAMVAAEKAVNAALTAAEKAVDKAEQAQALRNEAQNEFRESLSDLSGLMWTSKEGIAALDALRREQEIRNTSIEEKMTGLATDAANLQGRLAMLGFVWGIIVIIVSVVADAYFRH
jgi:hypothetical protein